MNLRHGTSALLNLLVISVAILSVAEPATADEIATSRVRSGLHVLYDFAASDGAVVKDRSGVELPLDLYFVRREREPAYGGKSYEALIRGDWKLMQNDPYNPLTLYNLREDPREERNLVANNTKVFSELNRALRAHIQRGGVTPWQRSSQ